MSRLVILSQHARTCSRLRAPDRCDKSCYVAATSAGVFSINDAKLSRKNHAPRRRPAPIGRRADGGPMGRGVAGDWQEGRTGGGGCGVTPDRLASSLTAVNCGVVGGGANQQISSAAWLSLACQRAS